MRRVLFIDLRNATRSQIAEAWLNHLAKGIAEARSCGTLPSDHVSDRAVQVMKEVGIDLRDKRPTPVTQNLMNWADMVVMLGTGIFSRAFMPTYIWDFEDSTGKSMDQVRALRDEIRAIVERLILEMQSQELESVDMDQVLPPYLEDIWN